MPMIYISLVVFSILIFGTILMLVWLYKKTREIEDELVDLLHDHHEFKSPKLEASENNDEDDEH